MTDRDPAESERFLRKEKIGLGILFTNLAGRLQSVEEVARDLALNQARGQVAALTVLVGPENCARMGQYLDEYRAAGMERDYGLPNRPRHREGAGCSAFGVSFLEVAGLLRPEWAKAWSKLVSVPLSLIGGAGMPNEKVGLLKLLTMKESRRWADPGEDAREIFFWDPDAMFAWAQRAAETRDPSFRYIRDGFSNRLVYDAREAPVSREPIWLAPSL